MPDTAPAIDAYETHAPFYDELFEPGGVPRHVAAPLVAELERIGADGLADAGRRRDAAFLQQGITFETSGADGERGAVGGARGRERPFPLDLVPRVLTGEEWRHIKRGLAQRIRALNHFVDDVYHAREIVRRGSCPGRSSRAARTSRARCTGSARPAASTATSPAATSCATATARGR